MTLDFCLVEAHMLENYWALQNRWWSRGGCEGRTRYCTGLFVGFIPSMIQLLFQGTYAQNLEPRCHMMLEAPKFSRCCMFPVVPAPVFLYITILVQAPKPWEHSQAIPSLPSLPCRTWFSKPGFEIASYRQKQGTCDAAKSTTLLFPLIQCMQPSPIVWETKLQTVLLPNFNSYHVFLWLP